MNALRLGHVHLKVRDAKRAAEFYCRVFGLQVEQEIGNFVFLSDGKDHHTVALQGLGPGAPLPQEHSVGLYHTAFAAADEAEWRATIARAEELGAQPVAVDHGISWAAYFSDPDGNGLEVYFDQRESVDGQVNWTGRSRRIAF
ncbi:MAG: VOC family protein [Armatimonadetes bacterium]|nr:VOC family protein [Armatimonadota bacterium]